MNDTLDVSRPLRFPILIGDIGGTNARFAILESAEAEARTFPVAQTADYPNIDDAIQACVLDRTDIRPLTALLALAGPIDGDEVDLTNAPWVVRPRDLIRDLGFADVVLLNDFEAQALAVSALPEGGRMAIGGGTALQGASRAVLGPGTGLGVAGLVHAAGQWVPVAGEGGHIDLGPRTDRDRAIWPFLETIEGRVSAEQILCGRGLVNLYNALCRADGRPGEVRDPADVTRGALSGENALAGEAVDLFATYLARVAGDLALIFMARGGVFIGGGILQRVVEVLDKAAMRAAFEDKAPHTALMASIPLFLITQPLAALEGLAVYARRPRSFGLETASRRWVA